MKPLLTGLLFGVAMATLAAPAPTLIPFQGRLTDQAGTAYTNGTYTLIFNLYDEAVGGRLLWTETHERVGVVNGTVNVFLGSINPALANVGFGETRHLGITIDPDNNPNTPDPEMVPRQMIIPAFWAKNSEKLAGNDWTPLFGVNSPNGPLPASKIQPFGITASQIAPNSIGAAQIADGQITSSKLSAQSLLDLAIPVGSVQAFAGNDVPSGWLLCDGKALNRLVYPRLFAVISTNWGEGFELVGGNWVKGTNDFNLPDLRGLFLRGVTGSRTNQWADSGSASRTNLPSGGNRGNAVGSIQEDAFQGHFHDFQAFSFGINAVRANDNWMLWDPAGVTRNASFVQKAISDGVNGTPRTASETRPKNAYVHYIIKY